MTKSKIILGIDFDDTMYTLAEQTIELAKALDASIVPAHAIAYVPHRAYHTFQVAYQQLRRQTRPRIEEISDYMRARGAIVGQPEVLLGSPTDVLLSVADATAAQLIAVGATRSKIRPRLLGSTASRTVRHAKIPVFVADCHHVTPPIRHVTCAVDLSEHSNEPFCFATQIASALDAELRAIHVTPHPLHYPGLSADGVPVIPLSCAGELAVAEMDNDLETLEEERTRMFKSFLTKFDPQSCAASATIRHGNVADAIVRDVQNTGSDLLVVGVKEQSAMSRFLIGSNVERLIREIPCSILAVRKSFEVAKPPVADQLELAI